MLKSKIILVSLFSASVFTSYSQAPCSYCPEMITAAGGAFVMGNNSSIDEKPAHKVWVDSFMVGKYETTQAQWRAVMGKDPANLNFKGCDQCPVEQVSWNEVSDYIKKLNTKSGKWYRLPTEAEWEFAARGGVNATSRLDFSGSDDLKEVGWYASTSSGKTHPVGQKKPNELGIFDMSGNVWEWCSDWYAADYYSSSPAINPKGPATGETKVLRGGGCNDAYRECRPGGRNASEPADGEKDHGFRLVMDLTPPAPPPPSCDYCLEMITVKGGTFKMGTPQSDDDNPLHSVTLSDFKIGKFEITQKQWKVVMGQDPPNLHFKDCDQCPVEGILYNEAQDFIQKLNALSGKNYRLPTEAEWEFAATGGNKSSKFKYSGSDDLGEVGWFDGNSDSQTHPVGSKKGNELGVFDMSGNVLEWCSDWYAKDYYKNGASKNPKGPISGNVHVIRGGSAYGQDGINSCLNSARYFGNPKEKGLDIGLRLVE